MPPAPGVVDYYVSWMWHLTCLLANSPLLFLHRKHSVRAFIVLGILPFRYICRHLLGVKDLAVLFSIKFRVIQICHKKTRDSEINKTKDTNHHSKITSNRFSNAFENLWHEITKSQSLRMSTIFSVTYIWIHLVKKI